MLSWLLVLTLYTYSIDSNNSQYKSAIRTATEAAAKQSGWEADFGRVRQKTTDKAKLFAKEHGLHQVAAVVAFAAPVVTKQRIRVRSGNFLITGTNNKAEILWTIGF